MNDAYGEYSEYRRTIEVTMLLYWMPYLQLSYPVRSKYSCGLAVIVFEQPTKTLSTLNRRFKEAFGLR